MRGALRIVLALALAATPVTVAACSDSPQPQVPGQPSASGMMPPPPQPFGVSDTPSGARVGDAPPDMAPRTAMNAQAAGFYQQALMAYAAGELAQAKNLFEQATRADPRAHQAFYSLGVVQEKLRDGGASASFRQAFTIVPDYELAIVAYAMFLSKTQMSEAERFLVEKRAQLPRSAAIPSTLAELKSIQKDTGSAQRIAQEALKINPDYRPAMVVIARDHYRARRLDLSLYALQAILDGFPPVEENPPRDKDNAEALLVRGLIWKEQGNRPGAMEQFKRAVELRPDLVEASVQLGTFLLEAGDADGATPILERAVKFDAENLVAHLSVGDAYRLAGKFGEAKREFEWVLARDANMPQVHYDLALLYLFAPSIPGMTAKQQISEAIRSLQKYQEVRPKDRKDDSDELLNRAKVKEGEINAANAPPPPPPPAQTAVPSATPSAPPADADAGAPPAAPPAAPPPAAPPPATPQP